MDYKLTLASSQVLTVIYTWIVS